MKKGVIGVILLIMLTLALVSCDRCIPDANGKLPDIDKDGIPDCIDESITLYSIDEFDGYSNYYIVPAGPQAGLWGRYAYDDLILSTEDYAVESEWAGDPVITFDISKVQWENAIDVLVKIYPLEFESCYVLSMSEIKATIHQLSETDYQEWEGCFDYQGNDCLCVPPLESSATSDYYIFQATENGWYQVSVFPDKEMLKKASLNAGKITISLLPVCLDTMLDLSVEDGGNHGSTGNFPTLEILYDYDL